MRTYSAYRFRTKDPSIHEWHTLAEDYFGHRIKTKDLKQIEIDGGPTVAAMKGWIFGKTLRPQSATLEAAGRAMGYKRSWVKMNGKG